MMDALASRAAAVTPAPGDASICASLPSATHAYALVRGDWSALPNVIGSILGRAVLVGAGCALLGERKHLVRNGLGGALGIEAFVLAWAWYRTHGAGARA